MRWIIILLFPAWASATNYYVAISGSDGAAGTIGAPWQNISRVNTATLSGGDSVFFNRGDTFSGTLRPEGGSSGNPVHIGAYGTGNDPIFSSLSTLSSWSGGPIYNATVSPESTINIVTVDGVMTPPGRYPNTEWLTYESHSGTTSITDDELTGSPDWTGALMVVRLNAFVMDKLTVATHSTTTLTPSTSFSYTPSDDYGYFFINHNSALVLDLAGEWAAPSDLYMYLPTDPSNYVIQYAQSDTGIVIRSDYVEVQNITIKGYNTAGIYLINSNANIIDCSISMTLVGIHKSDNSSVSTFDGLNISYCYQAGVRSDGNDTLRNSIISDVGLWPGMGGNGTTGYFAVRMANFVNSGNFYIANNTIRRVGYHGIYAHGDDWKVLNNTIDSFCMVLDDGAGIYSYIGDGTVRTGDVISGNTISNSVGNHSGSAQIRSFNFGIYLDDAVEGVTVTNNYISETYGSIFIHNSVQNTLTGNVIQNNYTGLLVKDDAGQGTGVSDNTFTDNTIVLKTGNQRFISYETYREIDSLQNAGNYNNNTYVSLTNNQPIFSIRYVTGSENLGHNYEFSDWRTLMDQDDNSRLITDTLPDYEYSFTGSNTFTNSAFTSNITGVTSSNEGPTVSIDWVSGTLEISWSPGTPSEATRISFNVATNAEQDSFYYCSYDVISTNNEEAAGVYLRLRNTPFLLGTYESYQPMRTTSDTREVIFQAPVDMTDIAVVMDMYDTYGVINIDNFVFRKIDATFINNQYGTSLVKSGSLFLKSGSSLIKF